MITARRSSVIEASPVEDIEAVFVDDNALQSRFWFGSEGRWRAWIKAAAFVGEVLESQEKKAGENEAACCSNDHRSGYSFVGGLVCRRGRRGGRWRRQRGWRRDWEGGDGGGGEGLDVLGRRGGLEKMAQRIRRESHREEKGEKKEREGKALMDD